MCPRSGRTDPIRSLVLVFCLAGCAGPQTGNDPDDPRSEGGGYGRSGYSDGNPPVLVNFEKLRDAVVETSTSGIPRQDVAQLRRIFCEGRDETPVIFFQLVVSTHWHYYWICSDRQPHRASTAEGKSRLNRWLDGFRSQAEGESAGCSRAAHSAILQGTHESGIRAVAFCDGKMVLNFPDGSRSVRSFSVAARSSGTYVAPEPQRTVPPEPSGGTCPACPRCEAAAACPECPRCPPPKPCPPPPPCPACDCTQKELTAGQRGFKQGVVKACRRICQQIYDKCRSIDPKTAMCHMMGEYCGEQCGK